MGKAEIYENSSTVNLRDAIVTHKWPYYAATPLVPDVFLAHFHAVTGSLLKYPRKLARAQFVRSPKCPNEENRQDQQTRGDSAPYITQVPVVTQNNYSAAHVPLLLGQSF